MFDAADRPQAHWQGEELEVTFTGTAMKADYGVPGSSVWIEIENVEIEEIMLLGVRVKPEVLPGELLERIRALSDELDW